MSHRNANFEKHIFFWKNFRVTQVHLIQENLIKRKYIESHQEMIKYLEEMCQDEKTRKFSYKIRLMDSIIILNKAQDNFDNYNK